MSGLVSLFSVSADDARSAQQRIERGAVERVHLQSFYTGNKVFAVACSPDGRYVAWCAASTVYLAEAHAGWVDEVAQFSHPLMNDAKVDGSNVDSLAFAGPSTLFSGHRGGHIAAYSVTARAQTHRWRAALSEVSALDVHARGGTTLLAAAVKDGHANVYDVTALVLRAAATAAATTSCDGDAPPLVASVRHDDSVRVVAFSPDGRWLVSGGDDKRGYVSDAARGYERRAAFDYAHWLYSAAFDAAGARLAVGTKGWLVLYDVPAFTVARRIEHGKLLSFCWLTDAHVAGASIDATVALWHASGERIEAPSLPTSMWKIEDAHEWILSMMSMRDNVHTLTGYVGGTTRVHAIYNLRGESDATAALFAASLRIFAALRRTRLGADVLQRVAEAAARQRCSLAPLADIERARIFTAARVSLRVRTARFAALDVLRSHHERMHWLRSFAPIYRHEQLAPLGPRPPCDDAAAMAWLQCSVH